MRQIYVFGHARGRGATASTDGNVLIFLDGASIGVDSRIRMKSSWMCRGILGDENYYLYHCSLSTYLSYSGAVKILIFISD